MLTHYTDAEIKQKLKELVVIADSRPFVSFYLFNGFLVALDHSSDHFATNGTCFTGC